MQSTRIRSQRLPACLQRFAFALAVDQVVTMLVKVAASMKALHLLEAATRRVWMWLQQVGLALQQLDHAQCVLPLRSAEPTWTLWTNQLARMSSLLAPEART